MLRHTLMMSHLLDNVATLVPPHVLATMFASCWPFPVRALPIMEAYLRRPDVQLLLLRERQQGQPGPVQGRGRGQEMPGQKAQAQVSGQLPLRQRQQLAVVQPQQQAHPRQVAVAAQSAQQLVALR